ncbi:Uncharacterised protein [Clostridioides difficile]|nr:Uncharacterised protein [Clostridioides difficile]SJQ19418.1 Uncharacterised protein [Clostridioides difficile]SJQ76239.1 Uncharacterised protein [Clostridioides difficile]SJR17433.1 Uncharacterised protein [Clostridioides difficile]SJR21423.1 Uncharacterised protein [Clostridioides difficile]
MKKQVTKEILKMLEKMDLSYLLIIKSFVSKLK